MHQEIVLLSWQGPLTLSCFGCTKVLVASRSRCLGIAAIPRASRLQDHYKRPAVVVSSSLTKVPRYAMPPSLLQSQTWHSSLASQLQPRTLPCLGSPPARELAFNSRRGNSSVPPSISPAGHYQPSLSCRPTKPKKLQMRADSGQSRQNWSVGQVTALLYSW